MRILVPSSSHVKGPRYSRSETFPHLVRSFYPNAELIYSRDRKDLENCDAILGWGLKKSSKRASLLSRKYNKMLLRCEDSFLRSMRPALDPPLSMIIDDVGMYYDCSHPSAIERAVNKVLSDEQVFRAAEIIKLWRKLRLSKYNSKPEAMPSSSNYVLVVDQVLGDMSISYGGARPQSFRLMLSEAQRMYPNCDIILKVHPLAAKGIQFAFKRCWLPDIIYKQSNFNLKSLQRGEVIIDSSGDHPVRLIEEAQAVFTVTSQLGLEALMWGKKVYCFGRPFYSGWGLTHDCAGAPSRRSKSGSKSLESIVHAAFVECTRYISPNSLKTCEVEELMAQLYSKRLLMGLTT